MKLSTLMMFRYSYLQKTPYKHILDDADRRRRDRRIPCQALLIFKFSSFYTLFRSGNDQAMLHATGHDHKSFNKLLKLFHPCYYLYTWDRSFKKIRLKNKVDMHGVPMGRPRDMSAIGCLGLVLMWYRTRGSCARSLSMIFGQTSSPLYTWLKFGIV